MMKKKNLGFTLIELAMVLFILALLLGSFLSPLATSIEQRNRQETIEKLEEIRESLMGYALVNGHFPCPDCPDNATGNCNVVETALGATAINDGIEEGTDDPVVTASNDRSSGNFNLCATEEGNLPWVTLDVSENDSWGNHFVYRVTNNFADSGATVDDGTGSCTNSTSGVSFCLESAADSDIDIDDEAGNSVAEDVPVVVVSLGNNSADAFASLSVAEQENQDGDTTFVSTDYIQATGSEFDDILIWISPPTLMYQMVRAERLP